MNKEETIHTQKVFIRSQIIFVVVLVVLFGLYLYLRPSRPSLPVIEKSTLSVFVATDTSPYINPAVTASLGKHFIINFKPLKDEFIAIQSKYPQKTYIYFDYLNNASWIGVNEDQLFTAASMVKVPLAMSIMKTTEAGELSLAQTYTLDELDLNSDFGNLYKVGADKSFTLQELLQIMLVNSDNTAMNALYKALQLVGINDPFGDVYDFMGWQNQYRPIGTTQSSYTLIDLSTLSNMFISLYDATYDNPQDSDLILQYLDDSTFNSQIVAGVPADIPVSHKIGVDAPDQVYSDCGIVYAPQRNYLLCLGSAGASQDSANQFMADISKAAYDYVIKN